MTQIYEGKTTPCRIFDHFFGATQFKTASHLMKTQQIVAAESRSAEGGQSPGLGYTFLNMYLKIRDNSR
jgi:hypothetical protein